MSSLPEFSVKHSIIGNMLTLFVLIAGLIMVATMPRDTFPELEIDVVVITTIYPNASAEEVEDLITNPIEDELRDVEDIDELTSTSTEGISVVVVSVNPDARHKERVYREIERKVDQVRSLPDEAEDPEVEVVDTTAPILKVCVSGDVSENELRDYGETLRDRLLEVSGVGTVNKGGWRDEEFWVEVDLEKVEQQELSLDQVVSTLARRNVNRPGGKIREGQTEVVLRTIGQFHNADEISRVVVRSNTDGEKVFIRDIATVQRTFEDDTVFTRANGTRAVVLDVKKRKSGDTIHIADAVKELLEEAQVQAPEGIALTYVDDESYYVKRRLMVLRSNGIIGLTLVVGILFLFLNSRVALVTGIGIPFAFLAALLMMASFGVTINLITMFGLIIVLGMVVDDAIIVGENIFRHMEEGMDPRQAAITGTTEVMFPVVSTVLTTIAAFIPLIFAPDTYGQVMKWFPIVVAMTLTASLFEVLLIMPCHVADFVRPLPAHKKAHKGRNTHPVMSKIQRFYEGTIRLALRARYVGIVIVLAVFFGLGALAKNYLRVDIFPADLIDAFIVYVWTEDASTLARTEEVLNGVEDQIRNIPAAELSDYVTHVGGHVAMEGGYRIRGTHVGSTIIYLTPQNTRERKTQVIIDELRERCKGLEGVTGTEFKLIEYGPPAGAPLEVRIRGESFGPLLEAGGEIKAFLEEIDGVYDIRDDLEEGKDEIQVVVNEEEAARLGVTVDAVSRTVMTAFLGAESTIVREGNDEITVRVLLDETYRNDAATVEKLSIRNGAGRLIPISKVADFVRKPGKPSISHFDGKRVVTITASIDTDKVKSTEVNKAVGEAFGDIPQRYPGYSLMRGGEFKETQKLVTFMYKAFGVTMLLIYVILAVQFNSLFQPFVVMASIPLGLVGVIMALILHGKPVSLMAMMGMIGMAGVVVNDAIVLVKFVNDRRRIEGDSVFDALVNAGMMRLRPILLTSVTTIAGLVPVIYGIGGYEPFVAPAAIALAYGLLFATVLTLVVVPMMYHLAYDLKKPLTWLFKKCFGFMVRSDERGA